MKFLFVLLPCPQIYKHWYCVSYMKGRRLLTVDPDWIPVTCLHIAFPLFSHETRSSMPHPLQLLYLLPLKSLVSSYMKLVGYSCLEFVIKQYLNSSIQTGKKKSAKMQLKQPASNLVNIALKIKSYQLGNFYIFFPTKGKIDKQT